MYTKNKEQTSKQYIIGYWELAPSHWGFALPNKMCTYYSRKSPSMSCCNCYRLYRHDMGKQISKHWHWWTSNVLRGIVKLKINLTYPPVLPWASGYVWQAHFKADSAHITRVTSLAQFISCCNGYQLSRHDGGKQSASKLSCQCTVKDVRVIIKFEKPNLPLPTSLGDWRQVTSTFLGATLYTSQEWPYGPSS